MSKVLKEKNNFLNKKFILYFIIIFIFVQIIGLFVSNYYIQNNLVTGIVTNNPNDIINVIFIVSYMLAFTIFLLVFKKIFKKTKLLLILEAIVFFSSLSVVFFIILPELAAYCLAIYLLIIKNIISKYNKTSIWYNNFILALSLAGAGSILGLSFGIIPVMVLITILAIYDLIAVFYTKHMINLANLFIEKKVNFIFEIPTKERLFRLGGGDIAIPLLVSSSLFNILIIKYSLFISLIPIILIWIASIIGLIWTFYILSTKKVKALPALPPQVCLMLVILVISYFILL
jgi:presenilin-like A22 family membrane protease